LSGSAPKSWRAATEYTFANLLDVGACPPRPSPINSPHFFMDSIPKATLPVGGTVLEFNTN